MPQPATKLDDDTPMMRQYQSIKRQCADAILFFRMGDFYEMFNDDAKVAAGILDIALTSRAKNKANPIPMCGVPHHAASAYISRLIQAGKKVAICEQMEDPKLTKGLVKRGIVRVVTPGTVIDDTLLDPKSNHFLAALHYGRGGMGLAVLDMSTGLFRVTEAEGENAEGLLVDELEKLAPKEVLVPATSQAKDPRTGDFFIHRQDDWTFSHGEAKRLLLDHFKMASLDGFGCGDLKHAVPAAGALLHYLRETQKSALGHITAVTPFSIHHSMMLDPTTVKSLELVQASDGGRKHSLLDLLDLAQTPMGSRRIKEWILRPRIDKATIDARLLQVAAFKEELLKRNDLRAHLSGMGDMERLIGRISLGMAAPRDLAALKHSIARLGPTLSLLCEFQEDIAAAYRERWDGLDEVFALIDRTIEDDPPLNVKNGRLIRPGCDAELDRLRSILSDGKNWIARLEADEKERSGIPALKVGYNKIYGYYIEITKRHLDRVPENYIRKQSLVNAERFISPELKERETEITGAEDQIGELEARLFKQVQESVAAEGARIQRMAAVISELDALAAFAETAHRYNYTRPVIREDATLLLEDGRHPLVEKIDPVTPFIPNDTHMDADENQIMMITGPNMAGKSTYLRQVALITLLAQVGSFVPARRAEIGLVDRIFSRVGAQDHLLKGQSTFMVEMNETANILNNATSKSLIILDEIGRGTSTFDGISIAWAVVEYLHGREGGSPKTLFATHYHELTDLAHVLPGVKNFNVQVKEWNDEIIFLRKIAPGGADKSYGIQVARLAGLPRQVLTRAFEILDNLEKSEFDASGLPTLAHSGDAVEPGPQQLSIFQEEPPPLIRKLEAIDPENLTPRQALDQLYELVEMWKRMKP
jgi:DNA mismatch repair protein MutS